MDSASLLEPSEPSPLEFVPGQPESPFLLSCDHAGRLIPQKLETLGVAEEELRSHIAWDLGAAGFARLLAKELGAPLYLQRYSRLVIDCNRPLEAPDSIAERSGGIEIPGNHGLGHLDRQARVDEIFRPYHAAIEAELARRQSLGQPTILLTLHSFTPSLWGQERPWHTGILYLNDRRLVAPLLASLAKEPGLVVGDNEPYSVSETSDYAVIVYGERANNPYVEIEIRQDLLASHEGQQAWATRYAQLIRAAVADAGLGA